jgi:hypothetical protein
MTEYLIFTDNWWNWFLHEYAFTLGLLWAFLKTLAILDPSNKTNAILDTFRGLMPGNKELARRATDKPEEKETP